MWSLCDENKDGKIAFNEFLNKLVSNDLAKHENSLLETKIEIMIKIKVEINIKVKIEIKIDIYKVYKI